MALTVNARQSYAHRLCVFRTTADNCVTCGNAQDNCRTTIGRLSGRVLRSIHSRPISRPPVIRSIAARQHICISRPYMCSHTYARSAREGTDLVQEDILRSVQTDEQINAGVDIDPMSNHVERLENEK
jgi:hypothetical protein